MLTASQDEQKLGMQAEQYIVLRSQPVTVAGVPSGSLARSLMIYGSLQLFMRQAH
jgi:hypothetical protein